MALPPYTFYIRMRNSQKSAGLRPTAQRYAIIGITAAFATIFMYRATRLLRQHDGRTDARRAANVGFFYSPTGPSANQYAQAHGKTADRRANGRRVFSFLYRSSRETGPSLLYETMPPAGIRPGGKVVFAFFPPLPLPTPRADALPLILPRPPTDACRPETAGAGPVRRLIANNDNPIN